jgi:hypothetical protein
MMIALAVPIGVDAVTGVPPLVSDRRVGHPCVGNDNVEIANEHFHHRRARVLNIGLLAGLTFKITETASARS